MNDNANSEKTMKNTSISSKHLHQALIICDVDEVVVHFLRPFREFLNNSGFRLEANNFSLNDNIYSNSTNKLAAKNQVQQLISQFYEVTSEDLPIVEGAKTSLLNLSNLADIIFLTNIPEQFKTQRQRNLIQHGLKFKLVLNHGPKGPLAATLAGQAYSHIFFLDDNPLNLMSAQENIKNVHLIQFIADDKFFDLAPNVKGVKLKTQSWLQVEREIKNAVITHST